MATKLRAVVASLLEIATACRSLLVQQAENQAAAKGLPVPHINGQLNGWLPTEEIRKLLPCCICNMEPVTNDSLVCVLEDGGISAAHTNCLTRKEIPDDRDVDLVAARLYRVYPHLFEAGKRLSRETPRPSSASAAPKKRKLQKKRGTAQYKRIRSQH